MSTIDRYPTRDGGPVRLLPRREPRWSRTDGPLWADEVEAFERDGAIVVPDVFSAEEVATAVAAIEAETPDPDDPLVITEPGSDEVRSVFDLHRRDGDDPFAAMCHDPRVVDMACQLLDDDVRIFQSRINVKPAFHGRDFQWHSDFETWHAEDGMPAMRCVSASVWLTDNFDWNGPLLYIPGSHRTFVTCPTPTPPDNHETSLREQVVGVPDEDSIATLAEQGGVRSLTGRAGSVVLFDCNVLHASPTNVSHRPRSNLFTVFNAASNELVEPFAAPERRPNHLADRRAPVLSPTPSDTQLRVSVTN